VFVSVRGASFDIRISDFVSLGAWRDKLFCVRSVDHFENKNLVIVGGPMGQEDWAKTYAAMDKRLMLKYEHLPKGEQIGKKPELPKADVKKT
jgi:hypothetical protein